MKLVALVVASFGLLVSSCGSGSFDCSAACNKVYDQCGLVLQGQGGNNLSKAECNTVCNANTTNRQQSLDCIKAAACSGINACLQ